MILSELDFTRPLSSRIHFGNGIISELATLLRGLSPSRTALIADSHVLSVYGLELLPMLQAFDSEMLVLEIPEGERSKSRGTVEELQDRLLESGFDRKSLLIGFGGGVALDITGYVAATLLRGIRWVSLPTSLLAQVDAGIGGKTGVNVPSGKNLIGAFHPPTDVVIDPAFLSTLDPLHLRNGLAEVVKHGWIADPELFAQLERFAKDFDSETPVPSELVERAVRVKTSVVAEDPYERGRRAVLNAGHTVAHAIEAASGHSILHGFAVALGLAVESDLARNADGLPETDYQRLLKLLSALELIPESGSLDFDSLVPFLKTDKKNIAGAVHLARPSRIGNMAQAGESWTHEVSLEQLKLAWERRP